MGKQQSDAILMINNEPVGYVPDSLEFDEGLGEQKVLPVSEGKGRTSQVYGNDLTTNFGAVSVSLRVTIRNIERAKQWKENANRNVIEISGSDDDGNDFIRSYTQVALTNNYKVPIESEGVIELEFMGNAPI